MSRIDAHLTFFDHTVFDTARIVQSIGYTMLKALDVGCVVFEDRAAESTSHDIWL